MSNEFRILLEETFSFKGGKLYLMLLRENENFGVEVVDRDKTFGRKYTEDRKKADFLFETISNRLSAADKLSEAEKIVINAFTHQSIDKTIFTLTMYNRVCSQSDVVSLKKNKVNFHTRLQFGYRKKVKDKESVTIYVYENRTDKKPFGILYGGLEAINLIFELI